MPSNVMDLMTALQASLDKTKKETGSAEEDNKNSKEKCMIIGGNMYG